MDFRIMSFRAPLGEGIACIYKSESLFNLPFRSSMDGMKKGRERERKA